MWVEVVRLEAVYINGMFVGSILLFYLYWMETVERSKTNRSDKYFVVLNVDGTFHAKVAFLSRREMCEYEERRRLGE